MYTTNPPRAVLAILVGILSGAVLVALWSFWGITDLQYLRAHWRRDALLVFTYAAFVWAAGLIVVAPGPWVLLHRKGMRSWWVATILGAVLSFVIALALMTDFFDLISSSGNTSVANGNGPTKVDGRLTWGGLVEAVKFSLVCSALGALVGLAVWRTAYRWQPSKE